jgi:hypothetical protein
MSLSEQEMIWGEIAALRIMTKILLGAASVQSQPDQDEFLAFLQEKAETAVQRWQISAATPEQADRIRSYAEGIILQIFPRPSRGGPNT